MKKKIILLAGPTASGKTKIAIKLAQKINGEIINTDSMQVYKDFHILSSRPNKDELKLAKHHLYGFQSSGAVFSSGIWLKLAENKIHQINDIETLVKSNTKNSLNLVSDFINNY